MRHATFSVAVALVFAYVVQVSAVPITEADFDNPTLIDFDSIVGSQIFSPNHPNPFAPLGVTFTGFVSSSPAFGHSPHSGKEMRSGFATGLPNIVRADFSVPVNRVGAHAYAPNATLTVSIYDESNALIESITGPGPSFTAPQFFGLESAVRIGRVEFIQTGSNLTTFPGIDNFRFEETIPPPPNLLVDIKPGSDPNSINLGSRGVLPVAILSTDDFDALQVDLTTVLFGDPNGNSIAPLRSSEEDVNGDGLTDLTLKFSMRELVDNGALGGMSVEGILIGLLLDGTPFEGSDSIRLVPPGDGNNDQIVNAADYTIWADNFGTNGNGTPGDFNEDNHVDAADYTMWADNFGTDLSAPGSAAAAVPEPSTFVLSALGLFGLLASGFAYGWRRRRRA